MNLYLLPIIPEKFCLVQAETYFQNKCMKQCEDVFSVRIAESHEYTSIMIRWLLPVCIFLIQ